MASKKLDETEISATEFQPINTPITRQSRKISSRALVLISLTSLTIIIIGVLMVSRSVVFITSPNNAEISIDGLSFNIGNNFLLMNTTYTVNATSDGYYPYSQQLDIKNAYVPEFLIELEPLPGNLLIESDQSPIEVSLDGNVQGMTPLTIEDLSQGLYNIELRKYGYFPQSKNVAIKGLGETEILSVTLEPALGDMMFITEPPEATISVDGILKGKTPLTTQVLETGSAITIEKAGYNKFEEVIFAKANSISQHETIFLELADGEISIVSSPSGASVTIDNKYVGTTPMDTTVAPNKPYEIELYLEGYIKESRSISLKPAENREIKVSLNEDIGEIYVDVSPADALISIDGVAMSTGSQNLKLATKKYKLSVSKNGFETKTISINPRPKIPQAVSIQLITTEEAYWASRPEVISTPLGNKLKLFKPNDEVFSMGAPRREPGRRANEAEKRIQLQRPFYFAITETSNKEYRQWKSEHNSSSIRGLSLDLNDQPVANIAWQDAALFCNWLSEKENLPKFYNVVGDRVTSINWDSNGYRLPTESEWSWVAKVTKAGSTKVFPWNSPSYPPPFVSGNYADESAKSMLPFTISNYNDSFPVSASVGSFRPNEKGIFNLSGNVAEWVNDFYEIRVNKSEPLVDYRGPNTGNRHVIRGASWALGSRSELRLSYREPGNNGKIDVGFRIARYVDKPKGDL